MGRIVAGGGHSSRKILRYVVEMSGKEKAHFLFIATPSSDKPEEYAKASMRASDLGCETRPLYLCKRKYTDEQLDELFSWADIIYVCGGDTFRAVEIWKNTGIDRRLRDVFERDSAILCGSSAGGICWFRRGFSDSSRTPEYGKHGWVDGIGIFPDRVFCPHFANRGDAFRQALRDSGEEGMALDNYTAYVYDNGRELFLRRHPEGNISVFTQTGDGLLETVPDSILLEEYYPDDEIPGTPGVREEAGS